MKKKKLKIVTHRIAYDVWANSQLSVIRFYGGGNINGKLYVFDQDTPKAENGKYFPDLVTYQ